MANENDEKLADLERREAALRADRLRFELRAALTAARCRAEGLDDAVAIMAGTCAAELDEQGRITKLTFGENEYDTPAAAVEAFLGARAYFKEAGQPTPAPAGDNRTTATKPDQLAAEGWNGSSPPAPATSKAKAKQSEHASVDDLLKSVHSPGELAAAGWAEPAR
jgi:hypothetical protein